MHSLTCLIFVLVGHARPFCALACRLALFNVHVTLLTTPRVYERVKTEVSRGFSVEDGDRQGLVRCVVPRPIDLPITILTRSCRVLALDTMIEGLTDPRDAMKLEFERHIGAVMSTYALLLHQQPVTCFTSKTEFPPAAAPKMVVVDVSHPRVFLFCSHSDLLFP